MKNNWSKLIIALFLGVLVTNIIIVPSIATVYAAEQTATQGEQQPLPPPNDGEKKEDNGHAGHH